MSIDTAHAPAGEDLSADEFGDHQHGATDKQYILIALLLAAITAAEVAISYIDVGPLFLPALLIMMVAKFFIVVSFFMHLKFDHKLFSWLFYMGLVLALIVYIGTLAC
ncbi:MAG: cytochrome C oxidase subunit IV family protein, partial [Desertimonas sp.]